MSDIAALVADNLDIFTGAIERKSGAGRSGGSKRISLYGIERLRALVLDLAVRGKLVPQDPADEPAADLLRRVKAERAKLIKNKKIGKGKSLPTVSDTPPFDIPESWEWTQLSEVGHDWGQREPDSDFTYIDVSAIDQSAGAIRSPSIVAAKGAPSRARKIVRNGTIIYSTVRPYLLNIAIIDQEFAPEPIASTAFAIIHPFTGIEARFFYRYLRSPAFVTYVESCQTGIAYPAINDRQFFSAWCPLPPSNEQRRIVAKVDELMALCDALERESTDALAAHQTLVETLLATLVNSADAADLAANWARLESHFDTLFTTEASIDALKQTILDLAVRGKLTEQDTEDEVASELLKQTISQKIELVKQGKAKRAKPLPKVESSDAPFDLPRGWAWARFPELGIFERGKSKHRPRNDPKLFRPGIYPLVQTGEVARSNGVIQELHSEYSEIGLAQSKLWPAGTLCITIAANIADAATLGFDACFPDSVVGFIPCQPISSPQYFLYFMRTAKADLLKFAPSTAQKNINLGILETVLIPLPPLAEQHRIVAKVDELMALCDALKARLADAAETRRHLADAIVERAAA